MKEKKGQAAMEFLMTYGWAILAAIIVVGVLWYIIGDPTGTGADFVMTKPFVKNAMSIDATGDTILLEFRNGLAEDVNITQVKIGPDCQAVAEDIVDVPILAGELGVITATCTGDLVSGARVNEQVVIYHTVGSGTVEEQAVGSIKGKLP